jgi:hypothetical protein
MKDCDRQHITVGMQVFYQPAQSPCKYVGYVGTPPLLIGDDWCVTLVGMCADYQRKMQRSVSGMVPIAEIEPVGLLPIGGNSITGLSLLAQPRGEAAMLLRGLADQVERGNIAAADIRMREDVRGWEMHITTAAQPPKRELWLLASPGEA